MDRLKELGPLRFVFGVVVGAVEDETPVGETIGVEFCEGFGGGFRVHGWLEGGDGS